MVNAIDDKPRDNTPYVRALLYENTAELSGNVLVLKGGEQVICLPGSVAFKAGFKDMKQLDANGAWITC